MSEQTIWAVVYGNYDPPEVSSLHDNEDDAKAARDKLGGMYEVEPMTLNRRALDLEPLITLRDLMREHHEGGKPLFQTGDFLLSGGERSEWRINVEELDVDSIKTLARLISTEINFSVVEGVPTGGERLAGELRKHADPLSGKLLIVDDVLTTGKSMERQRAGRSAIGVVIFSRSQDIPSWIRAVWTIWEERGGDAE